MGKQPQNFCGFFEKIFCSKHVGVTKHSLIDPLNFLCHVHITSSELAGVTVNTKEAEALAEVLRQFGLSRTETTNTVNTVMRGFAEELRSTQKLWRKRNNPFLIKAGLALIAFPDPTISDVIGSALVAAGLIQLKLRNSTLHIEDVYKTLPKVVKELGAIKQCLV